MFPGLAFVLFCLSVDGLEGRVLHQVGRNLGCFVAWHGPLQLLPLAVLMLTTLHASELNTLTTRHPCPISEYPNFIIPSCHFLTFYSDSQTSKI